MPRVPSVLSVLCARPVLPPSVVLLSSIVAAVAVAAAPAAVGAGAFYDPLDDRPHVPQAASPLRVADVAGALIGVYAGRDPLHDRRVAGLQQLRTDGARRVAEAVTDEHVVVGGVFLVHSFAQRRLIERLQTISGVVDGGAVGRAAEAI